MFARLYSLKTLLSGTGFYPNIITLGIIVALNVGISQQIFATKTYYHPNAQSSYTGGATVCQNGSVTLSFSYSSTTCTSGSGSGTSHVSLTVKWYSNTVALTSGGTLVYTTSSTDGAGALTYAPGTSSVGTLYYYVVVSWSSAGCVTSGSLTSSSTETVTVNALPTSYSVTGGGVYCSGGSGVAIGLSGSQTGVNYQLQIDGVNTGTAVTGSGSSLNFGNKTAAGTYTVVATNATSGCSTIMSGSATITVNTAPSISSQPSTGSQTLCQGSATTAYSVTASGTSISYQWYSNTTASNSGGTLISGATSSGYTPSTSVPGTLYYYCKVAGTCSPVATSNVSGGVTVNALAGTVTVTGGGSFCGNTTLTASNSGGGTVYFQGTTSGGTSTATPSTSQVVSSSGTYYFRAYNGTCWGTEGSATVTISTAYSPGTYNVGPTGTFTSIGNALTALNGSCTTAGAYILALQSTYNSSVESFPLSISGISWMSATNTITIRPATGATGLSITSSGTTGTVNLNSGSYFIFDGRPGGTGTVSQLSIKNTSTSGYAIQFINDATYNTIKYCSIQGVNTSTSEGVVNFATTSGSTGNDHNTIDNCDIGAGTTTPTNLVYSSGTITTTATFNSSNTISNCTIHDFFNASNNHNGIWLSDGSTEWKILNNSFYETVSRNITGTYASWAAIRIQNYTPGGSYRSTNISSCNNTQITGNYIGGTGANAGGSPLTITGAGALRGIVVYGGSGAANSIQGNTIANIAFTTSAVSINSLIYHADGNINIGTTTPNTIGTVSGTGNIVFTYNVSGGTGMKTFSPIFLGGAITTVSGISQPESIVPGTVNFENNTIGGITAANSKSDSCQLRIIDFEESIDTFNISGNTIGNATPNNILNTTKQGIIGVIGFSGTPGATQKIDNNVVQNFYENNAAQSNQIVGISPYGDANQSPTGLYEVNGNIIRNLISTSKMTPTYGTVILGIDARASSPGQFLSGNTLYNFVATDNTVTSQRMRGILFSTGPSTGTNTISKNIVYNLVPSAPAGVVLRGIELESGPFTVQNNMVVLGYDTSENAITNNMEIEGIYNGTGANTFYYNSVNIGGTGVAGGSSNSYAFYSNNTSSETVTDNLLANNRSNSSGTAKNYAIAVTNPGSLTSDYNDYYISGTGGVFANNGSDQASLAAWQSATTQDSHSINAAPGFVNAATDLHLTPSPSSINFNISNQGIPVGGITTDIDGDTRNAYTPDPGFDEFGSTGSWIGTVSSDWNNPANWNDNIVPTSSVDVKILNAPNMPSIATGTQSVRDLYINTPGTLTIGANGKLQLSGTIHNNGTFDASAGTVEFNGSSAQSVPANAFLNNALYNLIVSNTSVSGLALGGTLDVYGSVSYTGTGKSLTTNNYLTLKSNASNTAWVGDMTGNSISGNVTVERYLESKKAWRFLSVPTNSSQTIQQAWQEGATSTGSNPVPRFGIQLTGAGGTAAGFDAYSASPSMKTYNSSTGQYVGVPSTNATNIASSGPYMVFVRGDRTVSSVSAPATAVTLRTKGTLYTGTQSSITVPAGKFVAIGNPYASALDMRNISKSGGTKDFFYVWDPTLSGANGYGGFQTFSNNGSGNYVVTPGGGSYGSVGSISNYIQSGQAFFVQGGASSGSFTFSESCKTSGSSIVNTPAGLPLPQLRVTLMGLNTGNAAYVADGVLINYSDNYSNKVDDMDAIKSSNSSENLSVKRSGSLLAVERRHTITANDTIFLNLTGVSAQKYEFDIRADQIYQPGLSGFLVDNYLKTSTPINTQGITDVTFAVTGVAASYAAGRFMIVFDAPAGTLPVTFTSIQAFPYSSAIDVQWQVAQEMNIDHYETEKSTDGTAFVKIASTNAVANSGHSATYLITDTHPVPGYNYYRIKSVDIDGQVAYSSVAKVNEQSTEGNISVFPNPVVNGTINLQLNNQLAGKYIVKLFSKTGQLIIHKDFDKPASPITLSFQVGTDLSHGIYNLVITKPDNTNTQIKLEF